MYASSLSALVLTTVLGGACTLSFDLPAQDAGATDANESDADSLGVAACQGGFDPITQNLLTNGGFEDVFNGWSSSSAITATSDEALVGASSAMFTLDTQDRSSSQSFAITPGSIITVSGWIKTEGVTGLGCRLRARASTDVGEFLTNAATSYVKETTDWTLVQTSVQTEVDTPNVLITMQCREGTGTAFFDNVFYVNNSQSICGNLNCEFEERCPTDCEGGGPQKVIDYDGFDENFSLRWDESADRWLAESSEAKQNDPDEEFTSVLLNSVSPLARNYKMFARATRRSGDEQGAIGVMLRGGVGGSYDCRWQPDLAALEIHGPASVIERVVLDEVAASPDYDPDQEFWIEASVIDNQVYCCIHDIPGADLLLTNMEVMDGQPGLMTSRASASFDSVSVLSP